MICPASYDESDLDAVALGMKPFIGVAGRDKDYLISPRGEILNGMSHLPWEVSNIVRIQLIQESPRFVKINVVPGSEFGETDRKVLYGNIRLLLPDDIKVEIELVDGLVVSASGKTPYIVRRFESSNTEQNQR